MVQSLDKCLVILLGLLKNHSFAMAMGILTFDISLSFKYIKINHDNSITSELYIILVVFYFQRMIQQVGV
jgi:hypothetical protein